MRRTGYRRPLITLVLAVVMSVPAWPGGCFPAGTEVLTADSRRAIETVQAGAQVRAYDPGIVRWEWATVNRTVSYRYERDMVTVRAGAVVVRSTGNHPLFVLRGEAFERRPWPADVPEAERQLTPLGRWVEARDLLEGDVLLSAERGSVTVSAVHEATEVYNLTVDRLATYAVHRSGLLVHNKTMAEFDVEYSWVAIDRAGNVYAAGRMHDDSEYTFGPGVTVSSASRNVVLLKCDSSGTAQWARSTGSFAQTVPRQVMGLPAVTAIVRGEYSTFALTQDGSVSAWGDNRFGQLGTGQW